MSTTILAAAAAAAQNAKDQYGFFNALNQGGVQWQLVPDYELAS